MTAARLADPPQRTRPGPALSAWVALPVLLQLGALLATSARYGYHRDEMYFIVSGQHPAWGYPDQPLIVPFIAAAMHHLAPGSLTLLRTPSAIVVVLTTVVAALIARECNGDGRAQVLAAWCTAVSGFALAVGHIVSTTTFDMLSTTLLGWLVIRALQRHHGPDLLWAGVAIGVGFEAKPQVGVVAVVMLVVLLAVGPRWPLRSPWLWAGIAAALVLAAPYLVWQTLHGWPQLTVAGNVAGSAEGGRIGFIPFQLVLVSPVLVPVWIAGLVRPLRAVDRSLRVVPITFLVLAAVYLLGNGKAYYLASLYPVLLGIGAVPTAAWLSRGRARLRSGLLIAGIVVSAAVSALIALPLLPETALQGSATIAINPDLGEEVGWPRFVVTVDHVWGSLPPAERAHTVLFTENYGEAAAIDLLGHRLGLPRSYSGHNGFSEWGRPGPSATRAVVIGFDGPSDAAPQFVDCHIRARVYDGVGLDNDEQGLPVMLCRPSQSWTVLWPRLRHYD